ncbi:ABC transporter permease, partial [Pseudonocardia hydrocarbonoxydans]
WLPRRPAVRVGIALRGGRVRRGVAGTLAVLGAAAVIAGVVAGATFGAGLQRLVDTPARYGQHADISLIDAREDDVAALVADPRVAALDVMTSAEAVTAAGEGFKAVALDHRLGNMPVETPAGRPPQRAGEIAVGPRLAERLGVVVGDVVEVAAPGGATVPLTVTGVVVVLSEDTGEISALGEVALVTPDQLVAVTAGEPLVGAYLQARPGQAGPLFDELSRDLEVFLAETPAEIRNLADIVALPELLALGLALVGAAGLVHAVVTGVRRTAPSLAALAVLGATPRQVCATVVVMATWIVVPALLVGVPLGLAVARLLWWEVATSTGVGGDVALPVGLLVAIGPVVLLAAVLASLWPALRVARTPPATVLRES